MNNYQTTRRLGQLSLAVLLTCVGCWKAHVPMNDKVEGTVKLNGKPVVGVLVAFVPDGVSGLLSGSAITDANGHYEMQTGEQPGAVLGKHSVLIHVGRGNTSRADDPQAAQPDAANTAPAPAMGAARVPPGYSDLQKPLLKVEVTADKHTDYDFDLGKSAK
jgi:hypothetical protein